MPKRCKDCLCGFNADCSQDECYDSDCEYFAPLTQEAEDEMIYDIIEEGRQEYYNAYIEYIDDNFYFD